MRSKSHARRRSCPIESGELLEYAPPSSVNTPVRPAALAVTEWLLPFDLDLDVGVSGNSRWPTSRGQDARKSDGIRYRRRFPVGLP